ncbi:MAG TPA: diguanylate cyclase [Kosmotogaceae bacterium]|nr:diguanylate cyclase [Kosmotogaceae bacterium]
MSEQKPDFVRGIQERNHIFCSFVKGRKRAEERIRHLSFHDYLTDLYNRAFIEEELSRLSNSRALPLGILMCDVNGLKLVNDAFGHQEGDRLLQSFAKVLRGSCRREDLIGRWGGDEFLFLLPNATEQKLSNLVDRIRTYCNKVSNGNIPISVSAGYAMLTDPKQSVDAVIDLAEERMYRNKLIESRSARSAIITSLERTLRETTEETQEHAHRMRSLARKVGETLSLSPDELNSLELLASLHDIGKISIPSSILSKPGPLTSEEWKTVKKHPEVGYNIARSTPDLLSIADAILSHHERWDGSGYPQGLRKKAVPLLARIIAVIDAFDVMTCGRPYRSRVSPSEAIAELIRCSGSQFDPDIVEVFVKTAPFGDRK